MPANPTAPAPWPKVIGYAAFLAVSWTWCIGMYLPVILRRDFGGASFWVFALPNVIGAGAMGVFLWRRGASDRLLARHHHAATVFSYVTLAFQVYVLGALVPLMNSAWALAIGATLAGLVLGVVAARRNATWRSLASLALWIGSIGVVWLWFSRQRPPADLPPPTLPALDLLALAPVTIAGFLLCPYLDLTFHAARQSLPGRAGTLAFLIGFFVFFPAMIALTWLYSRQLIHDNPSNPIAAAQPLIVAHLAAQLTFTSMLHEASAEDGTLKRRAIRIGVLFVVLLAVGAIMLAPKGWTYKGLAPFEIGYRLFMAFYALVFPAYVLLCIIGGSGVRPRPDARTLVVLAAAIALASPFYWVGFVNRKTMWLLPGVLIWIGAKAFIRPQAPASPPAR